MGITLTRNRESNAHSDILRSILMMRCRNICDKCNIHFETKMDLNEHMQGNHADVSYMCDYCNLTCETWPTFQEHIYMYHRDLVFCSYCYKAYNDYPSLLLHWKIHEPYECEKCKDTFVIQSDLEEHRDILHRDMPFQRFFQRYFQQFWQSFTESEE